MAEGVFVIHWDDFRGLVVEKRFPMKLTLNEKNLNMIYYEHQQGRISGLKNIQVEGMNIASFRHEDHPEWIVCFIMEESEDFETQKELYAGMGRFIVELVNVDTELVNIEEILELECKLEEPVEEQKCAEIFTTPSSALLLEKMQQEGVEKAARLSMWLKGQVQTDEIDIRDVAAPLLESGVLRVERVGKTTEVVFLVKDIFGYRAPPVESVRFALETMSLVGEEYRGYVNEFYSPTPPAKGYNPTLPVDDPTSPIMEDRVKISKILTKNFHYHILVSMRERPKLLGEISEDTNLPIPLVQKVLYSLESDKVVVHLKGTGHWALVTNPTIDTFIPEYVLPIVSRKIKDKEITSEVASRYLQILIQNWGEK